MAESTFDAAEDEESLEPKDRRQRPRASSVELSPTGMELNMRMVLRTQPQTAMFIVFVLIRVPP